MDSKKEWIRTIKETDTSISLALHQAHCKPLTTLTLVCPYSFCYYQTGKLGLWEKRLVPGHKAGWEVAGPSSNPTSGTQACVLLTTVLLLFRVDVHGFRAPGVMTRTLIVTHFPFASRQLLLCKMLAFILTSVNIYFVKCPPQGRHSKSGKQGRRGHCCVYFLKRFSSRGPFLKSLLNLLQYFCAFFVFWPRGKWDLSSLTWDWIRTLFIGRWSVNHWTTMKSLLCFCWGLCSRTPLFNQTLSDNGNV